MMYAEIFIREFASLVGGQGGLSKLRGLILNLATLGKLTSQLKEDGSAQDLVIAAETAINKSVTDKKFKKPKYFKHTPLEAPLSSALPSTWTWTTLGNLGLISPRNEIEDDSPAGFVPMAAIESKYGLPHRFEERTWSKIKSGFTHVANGDVVLAKITPCFENGKSTVIQNLPGGAGAGTTELHVFRQLVQVVEPNYVLAFLKSDSFIEGGIPKMTGTAGQKRVTVDYFALSSFPLPPIAEQRRIVAKVDELMALCDEMEVRQENEARLNSELMASLVHAITEQRPNGGGASVSGAPATSKPFEGQNESMSLASDSNDYTSSAYGNDSVVQFETLAGKMNAHRPADVDTKFKEAVLVGAIVKVFFIFGGEPIGNFRLQKAVYFARRHNGEHALDKSFARKAAGPYNPSMKYSGGIAIAKSKNWLIEAKGRFGFGHIPGSAASEADDWIAKFSYADSAKWVCEQFKLRKNEEWETLATVDYAVEHLRSSNIEPDAAQVLQYIRADDEWRPKIEKLGLTEFAIQSAMIELAALFGGQTP